MKKKLPAFTLIELLVAMMVSSVVIASAYFVFSTFSKNLVDYKRHQNNLNDVVVLNGILTHDMNLAKAVRKNSSNDIAIEQERATIHYEWKEDFVLRITESSRDTFHLPVKNIEVNFMSKEQVLTNGLVDELKFTSMTDGQEFIFYFEKKYGSDILVESENSPRWILK